MVSLRANRGVQRLFNRLAFRVEVSRIEIRTEVKGGAPSDIRATQERSVEKRGRWYRRGVCDWPCPNVHRHFARPDGRIPCPDGHRRRYRDSHDRTSGPPQPAGQTVYRSDPERVERIEELQVSTGLESIVGGRRLWIYRARRNRNESFDGNVHAIYE